VERLFCNPRQMIESSEVTGWGGGRLST
jgi:hypothetical protein